MAPESNTRNKLRNQYTIMSKKARYPIMSELIRDYMVLNDKLTFDKASAPHGVLYQKLTDSLGNPFLKKIESNTVVLGGAILALEKVCGNQAAFKPKTLNEILGISVSGGTPGNEKLALFGVGTGGAQLDFGNVVAPDIKQNNVKDMVPLRYGAVVSGDDSAKYFMKKQNSDLTTYSWYLKEYDSAPVIKSFWKNAIDSSTDGTEITEDVSDSSRTEGIETYAQIEFSLNTNDVHEYFAATGNLSMARYNTFGFYTGEKITASGEYANTRLYAVVCFNNRDVSLQSSASFVYRVYSLT